MERRATKRQAKRNDKPEFELADAYAVKREQKLNRNGEKESANIMQCFLTRGENNEAE